MHVKTDGKSAFIRPCHLHMTCSVCWTSEKHSHSQAWFPIPVWSMCICWVVFCGLRLCCVQSHSDDMQLLHIQHVHFLMLGPQCHAFVYIAIVEGQSTTRTKMLAVHQCSPKPDRTKGITEGGRAGICPHQKVPCIPMTAWRGIWPGKVERGDH